VNAAVFQGRWFLGKALKRARQPGTPQQALSTQQAAQPSGLLAVNSAVWRVAPLVFGSGLCALIYQTAWQREFRLIFGASTAASAAVIAVFMGGLGLGARLIGPYADRRANPLRFYATLEALVAAAALTTPTLLHLARRIYLSLGGTVMLGDVGGTLARLALAGLVLLPACLFAGGTLGAAARAVEHAGDQRRRATALIYGLNTLGAVVGCLVATFWSLERFGTRSTLWLAALVNLLVAGAAVALSRSRPADATASLAQAAEAEQTQAVAPARFVLTAAALVGFAFFLMELVWYRMLGPILGGTVYTFGLVLAVALAGVALGGLLYAMVFARRSASVTAFSVTCLLESAAIALPYVLGDQLALLANSLRPLPGAGLPSYVQGWTAVAAIVVLPPSIIAGVQFPLLVALLGQGRAHVARHIGGAYLWNTVGGIVGSLAGGFGLLPLLTAPGCWKLVVLLLAALALVALATQWRISGASILVGAGALMVTLALLLSDGPTAVWRHSGIGVGRANVPVSGGANAHQAWLNEVRRSIVWEREGVESSVAVQTLDALSFVVNGKVDGNARNDAPTQVMGGLLGTLLRPGARRSLVIGLGTGSTAGWLAAVPGMETTDVVELEPAILDVARMCGLVNHGAMDDSRVHIAIGDAREALMAGRSKYDLIFSEPSNPYRAGVASLFTREFYAAVAARMEADGVFLQWVQAYDVDDWTVSLLVATLNSVFPQVEIWQVHQTDLLLVASRRPLRLNTADLRARIRTEPLASALRTAWRAVDLEDVFARFVAGPALARDVREHARAVNTDDRNQVEFAFARSLSRKALFDVARLRRAAAILGADRPAVAGTIDWARVARQRAAIYFVASTPPPVEHGVSESERTRDKAYAQYLAGDLAAAAKTFEDQATPAECPADVTLLAEGLAEAGDLRAVAYIKQLRELQPTEANAAAARLALRRGQAELAESALAAALVGYRTDPWPSQVSMSHALALADELTLARPDMAPVLFEALRQPFAVAALEEPRRVMRLSVESHGGTLAGCLEALAPFEPHVAWRADVLKYRADCYARMRDARVFQAQADLRAYRAQDALANGVKTSR
jgi:spermidine synthase